MKYKNVVDTCFKSYMSNLKVEFNESVTDIHTHGGSVTESAMEARIIEYLQGSSIIEVNFQV